MAKNDKSKKEYYISEDVIEAVERVESKVGAIGFHKIPMGEVNNIDYDYRYSLFVRERKLTEVKACADGTIDKKSENLSKQYNGYIDKKFNITDQVQMKNPDTTRLCGGVKSNQGIKNDLSHRLESNPTMGDPYLQMTPSAMMDYSSIEALRSEAFSLIIAYDCEWYYRENERCILSYQFAVIKDDILCEFIFIVKNKFRLTFELAIARILDHLDIIKPVDIRRIRRYEAMVCAGKRKKKIIAQKFQTYQEAEEHSEKLYDDGKKVRIVYDCSLIKGFNVTLLCHAGKGDLSAFDQTGAYNTDILIKCHEIQGGLMTLKPFDSHPRTFNAQYRSNICQYHLIISIRDTMGQAPAGMESLEALGDVVGYRKISLSDNKEEEKRIKSSMDKLLINDTLLFMEYASTDAVVTLLYASEIYGINKAMYVTITSGCAKVVKQVIKEEMMCTEDEFDSVFRGVEKVIHGKVPKEDKPGYINNTSLEPVSHFAKLAQMFAAQSYHGGYNSSSDIGFFPNKTFDYDLQNAYPTAMTLIADIDWENPIRKTIGDRKKPVELSLDDFEKIDSGRFSTLTVMFAYVRFEFPYTVQYPCIPVDDEGVIVYPRTSKGLDGVYACAPEILLALKLGAKVYALDAVFLNTRLSFKNGDKSYSLRKAVKQLVMDRTIAKKKHGKGSLIELVLKTMVNALYGKIAQNVVEKYAWSAYKNGMEPIGPSAITNPVSAAMITSIVRALLLAAQNQCNALGYKTFSVTTDGFISDIPENELKSLDLYGLRPFLEEARLYLTDGKDSELWEIKHEQDDLVNFTTRGNVSLIVADKGRGIKGGVCAHNGTTSGYKEDSFEDRLWLMKSVVSRDGRVCSVNSEWTKFKDLVAGEDFRVTEQEKNISMNYDLKRKPIRESFVTRNVMLPDGSSYEIACFSTMPFDDIDEYRRYRKQGQNMACLRTVDEWDDFFNRLATKDSGFKVRDMKWAILNACIIGHRSFLWNIPALDTLNGCERCAWINSHNDSNKLFKSSDWKNAGKIQRHVRMLPAEMIKDKLNELMEDTDFENFKKNK